MSFRPYLEGRNTEFIGLPFQKTDLSRKYDLVLCSHMLYHVEVREWPSFIKKLRGLLNPGGLLMINMMAQRGKHHEFCIQFNRNYRSSSQ